MRTSCLYNILQVSVIFPVFLILITLTFCSSSVVAEDDIRYVSDMLIINLKTSIEPPFKVVAKLYSNDRLVLLDTDGRFSKVRTEDNIEGWIATQYLTTKAPKTLIIEDLKSQLESSRKTEENSDGSPGTTEELENLKQLNKDLQESNNTLAAENQSLADLVAELKLQVENFSSKESYKTSLSENDENESRLHAQNKLLLKKIEELSIKNQGLQNSVDRISSDKNLEQLKSRSTELVRDNRELRSQVHALERERMLYWFIAGAVVFLAGMVSGKIFGRKPRKLNY